MITNLLVYNDRILFSHSSGSQKFTMQVLVGLVPSGGSEEASVPCLPCRLLVVSSSSGLSLAIAMELQFLPPSSPHFIKTLVTGFRVNLGKPGRSPLKIFNLITSARTLFPHKFTFTLSGWTYLLGSHRSTHYTPRAV